MSDGLENSLNFPRSGGDPLGTGVLRREWSDFQVNEVLGFVPEGEGEHQYLQITKRGINTEWLARQIAAFAGVKDKDIGYCGLKDRHAVTTQWFSVHLPKQPMKDWAAWAAGSGLDIDVLHSAFGKRKLRRGQHAGNDFVIRLCDFAVAEAGLQARLTQIAAQGVPNYFGEQRFGRDGQNLQAVRRWLEQGEPLASVGPKSIILSAARSYIFNKVLAARVLAANWAQVLPGDLAETAATDASPAVSPPTGPLWGRGRPQVRDDTLALEARALADVAHWLNGLEHCGLQQERRPLVLKPNELSWQYQDGVLTLSFGLTPGQYATTLLREIADWQGA